MAHTHATHCVPRMHGTDHRVAFRTFSPILQAVLAPTSYLCSHGRSELCRAGTPRPETHITQQQSQHDICPHAQREKTTHLSRKPAT